MRIYFVNHSNIYLPKISSRINLENRKIKEKRPKVQEQLELPNNN